MRKTLVLNATLLVAMDTASAQPAPPTDHKITIVFAKKHIDKVDYDQDQIGYQHHPNEPHAQDGYVELDGTTSPQTITWVCGDCTAFYMTIEGGLCSSFFSATATTIQCSVASTLGGGENCSVHGKTRTCYKYSVAVANASGISLSDDPRVIVDSGTVRGHAHQRMQKAGRRRAYKHT